ncbi:helix-turn-helix domain-containing protein [Marivibrio halodurans]|uniref:Helix-turn-helix domain-containing protein n=1 Tax=Marivibrio halodurans TaxID=2039722 RepID=A0A8J7S2N8_9PROT|nr:XRE family transcriptional regulator [Marivibrio halodurans]MBP5858760.1 helix-turn-helix domain-containing protein [Marivibrio halodurans]
MSELRRIPRTPPTDREAAEDTRPLEEYVGQEIRAHRKRQGMTMAELAAAAEVSQGMLSKIENGQSSPSLSTLAALANALSVPISGFFTPIESARAVSFIPAGEGRVMDRRGTRSGHLYQLLGEGVGGDVGMEPYLITLSSESETYDQFRHEGVEFIHVLSGELVYRHGDRDFHMKPGDSLFFDAGAPHGPRELIALPAVYLSIMGYKAEGAIA